MPAGAAILAAMRLIEAATATRIATRAFHRVCRRLPETFGVRTTVSGGPLPPGPCVLCPNHVSYMDILLVARAADVVFVSRGDLAGWPGIGFLARLAGTVFLDRSRRRDAARAADGIGEWLDRGFRVCVFLEGRNGDGADVLPFRSSLLAPACARGVPCVPVGIRYDTARSPGAVVARDVAWADDTPFGTHAMRLLGLDGADAHVAVGAPRTGPDRKALAAALEDDVRALATSVPSPGR